MAGDWPSVPLSALTEPDAPVTYGVVKPGPEDPDGVLFVRGGDIANGRVLTEQLRTITPEVSQQYRRTQLLGGELLVSLVGNPGQVAIVPDSLAGANIARQAGLIRLRQGVDTRFVRYFLSSRCGQEALGAHSLGSVQQVINLRDLKTVRVPLPPLAVQRRIAHILGTLDDKIELNRRQNETLEAMARALFRSWFVDFDPVRQKAAGLRPSGLDAATAALFPSRLVESELGLVPEGWRVAALADVADINARSLGRDYPHDEIDYVDISSVTEGTLGATSRHNVGEAPRRARRLVRHGDTIWSTVRPNRRSYLSIDRPADNLVVSTGFAVLSARTVPPSYLYSWVTTEEFVEYLTNNADGSAYPAVRADRFGEASVLLPTPAVLTAFDGVAGSLRARIAASARESAVLTELRDGLLPRLLSGEAAATGPVTV